MSRPDLTSVQVDATRLPLLLGDLRLPAIGRFWPEIAERSDREGWPAARFLATLLGMEVAERAKRQLTLALKVDPARFKSGRHLAAWIGLTPQERSSGGKQRIGGISRAGDGRLRQLLVLGATSVIRHAVPGRMVDANSHTPGKGASAWLLSLLKRRPRKVAAIALAKKMARIAWAMMTSGEA